LAICTQLVLALYIHPCRLGSTDTTEVVYCTTINYQAYPTQFMHARPELYTA